MGDEGMGDGEIERRERDREEGGKRKEEGRE
jgi:hypothetical protein